MRGCVFLCALSWYATGAPYNRDPCAMARISRPIRRHPGEQLHKYTGCLRLTLLAVNTFPRSKKLSGATRESFDKHHSLYAYNYQLNSRTNEQTRRGGQKGEFPASLPRRCTCKACIRSVPVPWGLCLRRNLRRVSAQRLDTGNPYIIRTTPYCEQSSGDVLSKRYAWRRRLFLRLTLDSPWHRASGIPVSLSVYLGQQAATTSCCCHTAQRGPAG